MSDGLKEEFADLVKQYVKDLKVHEADPYELLDVLVDSLYDKASENWYSSSRDC